MTEISPHPDTLTLEDPKSYDHFVRKHERSKSQHYTQSLLCPDSFDALIIGTNFALNSVLPKLLPFIRTSRPVVIYSPFIETLLPIFAQWRAAHGASFVNVQLRESWKRVYQSIPGKMHPMMNMNSGGGYILSATIVTDSEDLL